MTRESVFFYFSSFMAENSNPVKDRVGNYEGEERIPI